MIAIYAHGIPHVFPERCERGGERRRPATMAHREDWRSLPLITIDPADAKDHDDAVHAEPDPVRRTIRAASSSPSRLPTSPGTSAPKSALDLEALKRGNSVYFPDRVVPMLPERISNDLCSLKEGVDRPALAVRMRFSRRAARRATPSIAS